MTGPVGRSDLNIGPSGRFSVAMCERRARTVTFSGAWRRDAMAIASVRCRHLRIEPKHRYSDVSRWGRGFRAAMSAELLVLSST